MLRPYQHDAIERVPRAHPWRQGTLADRFWPKVRKTRTCWLWTGGKNDNGYGVIGRGARGAGMEKAHRVSWMFANGPIPDGLLVLHRCDNPACVNPKHLFLGTQEENMRDCRRKHRVVIRTPGFEPTLTKEQIDFIIDAVKAGFPVARLARVFNTTGTSIRRYASGRARAAA